MSHVDDEYAQAGISDPKVLITTSRDPSSKLAQFSKVRRACSCSLRHSCGDHESRAVEWNGEESSRGSTFRFNFVWATAPPSCSTAPHVLRHDIQRLCSTISQLTIAAGNATVLPQLDAHQPRKLRNV